MGIADRFLYLRDGRIEAEYTPEDLLLLPEADILGMGLRSPRKGMSPPAPSVLDESPAVLKTARKEYARKSFLRIFRCLFQRAA